MNFSFHSYIFRQLKYLKIFFSVSETFVHNIVTKRRNMAVYGNETDA